MPETQQVFVGSKNPMTYVLACITGLNETDGDVEILARGRSISRAVDAVEILKRQFKPNLNVKSVEIGTDELPNRDSDGTRHISKIKIVIADAE